MSSLPEFPGCFVCGRKNERGLKLPFSVENRGVRAEFTPDVTLAGYDDTVHDGIVSALLDEAIVWAAYVATGRFGVTADLNIRFLRPLIVGRPCIVSGHFLEDRKRLWKVESKILDQGGSIVARAVGKVIPQKIT